MTDSQLKAKSWLKSLITEVRVRNLREELLPENGLGIEETIYSLETTGQEAINLIEQNPLEDWPEGESPKEMTDEDLGQALYSTWAILSP